MKTWLYAHFGLPYLKLLCLCHAPHIFRTLFGLDAQNVHWKLNQVDLTDRGLGFGNDMSMVSTLIHGSGNFLKIHHGGEKKITLLCFYSLFCDIKSFIYQNTVVKEKALGKICKIWHCAPSFFPTVSGGHTLVLGSNGPSHDQREHSTIYGKWPYHCSTVASL